MLRTFFLALLLTGNFFSLAQLYGEIGVSVPDSKLEILAETGVTIGVNYEHKLGHWFKARLSTAYVHFGSKHYPPYSPVGLPVSVDFKTSMLPFQIGIKFFPFPKFLAGKLFIGGKLGVQAIFFESHSITNFESIFYKSKELDFSYVPSVGIDLNGACFEFEQQFIASNGNQRIKSVSYANFKLSVKIFKCRFK